MSSQNMLAKYHQTVNNEGKMTDCSGTLIFNSQEWKYVSSEFKNEKVAQEDDSTLMRLIGELFNFRSLKKDFYMDVEITPLGKCVIKDELQTPSWEILNDSTKKIGNYNCTMAKGHLCGRDFVAWFSPDIPVTCGPWKLWGLPGLIVDAYSLDGVIAFNLLSFSSEHIDLVEPVVKRTITPEEFKIVLKKGIGQITRAVKFSNSNRELEADASIDIFMPDKSLLE